MAYCLWMNERFLIIPELKLCPWTSQSCMGYAFGNGNEKAFTKHCCSFSTHKKDSNTLTKVNTLPLCC